MMIAVASQEEEDSSCTNPDWHSRQSSVNSRVKIIHLYLGTTRCGRNLTKTVKQQAVKM